MNSLTLKVLDEKAGRPTGNPFKVRTIWENQIGGGINEIGTGLSVKLAQDMEFSIKSLWKNVYVLGHRVDADDGELIVLVFSIHKTNMKSPKSEPVDFATVTIVEQSVKPVRFMESKEGKRVIMGGPEKVENDG